MIPINTSKLNVRGADIEECQDGSVRIIRYYGVKIPDELLTMQRRPCYYGESTEYNLSVHLPAQRKIDAVATVAHTSANCWKVSISTRERSDIFTLSTLAAVNDELKYAFK